MMSTTIGRFRWVVVGVADARVHQLDPPSLADQLRLAAALVDVAKHHQPRGDAFDRREEVNAAALLAVAVSIHPPCRWPMDDLDVGVCWDEVPLLPDRGSTPKVESPVVEPRLPWRPPELQAANGHAGVLQIGQGRMGRHQLSGTRRPAFEEEVMVASDYQFVRVRKAVQPVESVLSLGFRAAQRDVAGVHQDVTVRNACRGDAEVRVGQAVRSLSTSKLTSWSDLMLIRPPGTPA